MTIHECEGCNLLVNCFESCAECRAFFVRTVQTTLLFPLVIAAVGTCVITVLTTLTFDNTRVTIKIKIYDMSLPRSVAFSFELVPSTHQPQKYFLAY
jgi:hypothetical protein